MQVLETVFVPLLERDLAKKTTSSHETSYLTPVLSSLRRLTSTIKHAEDHFSGEYSPLQQGSCLLCPYSLWKPPKGWPTLQRQFFTGDQRLTIPDLPSVDASKLIEDEQLISRLEICMSEWTSVMQTFLQQEAHRHIQGKGKSS